MEKLFDLYFHNNIVMQNKPMSLVCAKRIEVIKYNYPNTKEFKKYYSFFKIKFNNSNYVPTYVSKTN